MKKEDIEKLEKLSSDWLFFKDDIEYCKEQEELAKKNGYTFIEGITDGRRQAVEKAVANAEKLLLELIDKIKHDMPLPF